MDPGRPDLYLSVGGFSTPDPPETASRLSVGGRCRGLEARYRGRDYAGTYTPTEITGTYEFVISGIGGEVSAFDAEILILKQNFGLRRKALTVTRGSTMVSPRTRR